MAMLCYPFIGENANFSFSRNCELRFCSHFHHQQYTSAGGRIKISHVGNSCNSKKLGPKNFDFFRFSQKWCGVEFLRSVCVVLQRSGALWNGWKNRGFPWNFSAI